MSLTGWIIALGCVGLVAGVVRIAQQEEERQRAEWQAFVDANDCHVVEVKDAQTGTSLGPSIGFDGKLTMTSQTVRLAAQECWLCANGIRYWKTAGSAVDRRRARP